MNNKNIETTTLFPKVLLLEHQFDNRTGLGITLSNLFANWPKEKLAIMAPSINVELCEAVRPCHVFIGGIRGKTATQSSKTNSLRSKIRRLYYYLGFNEIRYKFSYSEADINKAHDFNPDIIFSCLGSLNSMRDCLAVIEQFPSAKLVLYIVDDWVNTKENNRLVSSYWRKQNDKYFRLLMDKASGLLSICPYMSEVYKERYGKEFTPFHNPVDYHQWSSLPINRKYEENIKSILYVGKINDDTKDCLLDTAAAIDRLNRNTNSSIKYRFDVYTPNHLVYKDLFADFPDSKVNAAVPHSDILGLTKSYDALLLTLGFSKKSREYVRLSMPTKLSEYLAAGIPTILYCPAEIALAKYLVPNKCSLNCQERSIAKLSDAIKSLDDQTFCDTIVTNALGMAQHHDVFVERERFERTIQFFTSIKNKD